MLALRLQQQLGDLFVNVDTLLSTQGITAIFGVSGVGKTSLINLIGGLTKPDKGQIIFNDRVLVDTEKGLFVPAEMRRMGYVFQDARLFPHYSVKGNLQYGMARAMKSHFDDIVQLLGIETLLPRLPAMLSGGEKQRVAIGRALLTAPELLLMDEPLASLDLPRKRELLPYLEKLSQDIQIPILYVSHNLDEIVRLADNVIVMSAGKIEAVAPLAEIWSSSVLRPWLQADTLSSILNVKVIEHHPLYAMTSVAILDQVLWLPQLQFQLGEAVRIRIDAADVSLTLNKPTQTTIRNILRAKVVECIDESEQVDVKLAIDSHFIWARITRWAKEELEIKPDKWVYAQVKSLSLARRL
ncbi:MAG TPA: molybdenum ABC transporter ATP-binding protein ModC [Arsenophonus nasoniae]|uniref:molybdenum ABC transporter ATP-binding protein ModC n=1 Tax=Arsenophonus nasoniae TaxID=638 RepID=UPI003879D904